jgi:hypothetical protein
VNESGAGGSLQHRYEAMRCWWCTGEGDARDHRGLAMLLQQGMRVWMCQAAHAELRNAPAEDDLTQPRRASCGGSDAVVSKALHSEVARLLAAMAIGTIEAKEQTA